ncbi:hypothetical protein LZV00_11215 [Pseudomonas kielensis]|uniref:hypothetical protein n=1 Tax=Pseudomonas kielensis TaxID=2762577 RepID=UPI00223FCD0D|nr:hypothetical protein [Pseudomonas kielensis]UZM16235.1 hypothetical protein LZV00_11215 [Pseudomonas kielensis]
MKTGKSSKTAQPRAETPMPVSAEDLKDAFGAKKIPLASDFANLIEMADKGCRAVGLASDQDGSPGAGLIRSHVDDTLSVNAEALAGAGLDAKLDALQVSAGKGLDIIENKVIVKIGKTPG